MNPLKFLLAVAGSCIAMLGLITIGAFAVVLNLAWHESQWSMVAIAALMLTMIASIAGYLTLVGYQRLKAALSDVS